MHVIYIDMHLRAERVDTPPTVSFEDAEDANNHVEAPTLHQPEAIGGDDAHLDSEEDDPTEVFSETDDGKTGVS
ncbi:hypothetical protein TIFTF001_026073 [Ficus carica]|uniref:Uncharacterized protein n=1 Tax=Ficus carica TaxID=3494 RepID=A0AA88DKP3_FICCA|nr:hypothetical protein TIFTF001_026073 [Ficus carica]